VYHVNLCELAWLLVLLAFKYVHWRYNPSKLAQANRMENRSKAVDSRCDSAKVRILRWSEVRMAKQTRTLGALQDFLYSHCFKVTSHNNIFARVEYDFNVFRVRSACWMAVDLSSRFLVLCQKHV
jgi:hypothetical protein